jgi:cysteine desulfurase
VNSIIYLDNNATTPLDPRVLDAMMPYLTTDFANASSTHKFGLAANEAVKKARQQVADLIKCETNEIVFTSGATEAINLALKGITEKYSQKGKHIVTVVTEHSAVLDTCQYLETKGIEVTYLPVQRDGLVDLNAMKEAIRDDTILVSVMFANNETGVIQPIKEIATLVHARGSLFMTDATQAFGKIPIDVDALGIDLLTFSAHKIYGPKGIGGLFVRQRRPTRLKLEAIMHGGGHERGIRSGTLNVPSIVGLGKAAEIAKSEMKQNEKHIRPLRDFLEKELLKLFQSQGINEENTLSMVADDGGIANGRPFINGNITHRLYNTTNICFPGVDADAIMMNLDTISVSNGSACTAASIEPSHVLKAQGLSDEDSFSTLRLSLGNNNTKEEIYITTEAMKNVIQSLRAMAR